MTELFMIPGVTRVAGWSDLWMDQNATGGRDQWDISGIGWDVVYCGIIRAATYLPGTR